MSFFSLFSSKPTNNGRYTFKKYKVKNLSIAISVKNADETGKQVYIETFIKPILLSNGLESEEVQISSAKEFFDDVDAMVKFLSTVPESVKSAYLETLCDACRRHVIKYGRIIITDLKSLAYTVMYIADAIAVAREGVHINPDARLKFCKQIIHFASYDFKQHLWILESNTLSGAKYVKATDLP